MKNEAIEFTDYRRTRQFSITTFERKMTNEQIDAMAQDKEFPEEVLEEIRRKGFITFIRVETSSGLWAMEYNSYSEIYKIVSMVTDDDEEFLDKVLMMKLEDMFLIGDDEYIKTITEAKQKLFERVVKS